MPRLTMVVFGDKPDGEFSGELKGIIAAAYSLGAILSLPFIGIINDRFGRRWSIFGGSAVMVAGSILQGFSTHGIFSHTASLRDKTLTSHSRRLHRRSTDPRLRHPNLHRLRLLAYRRTRIPKGTALPDLLLQHGLLRRADPGRGHMLRHQQHRRQHGVEDPIMATDGPLPDPDELHLVRLLHISYARD